MRTIKTILLVLSLTMAGCVNRPIARDFSVGMVKSRVLEEYGPPNSTQILIKRTESIFGPIETFWSSLSRGDRVEIWSYSVDGGAVELYFVNRSDEVAGTEFVDEDAVY